VIRLDSTWWVRFDFFLSSLTHMALHLHSGGIPQGSKCMTEQGGLAYAYAWTRVVCSRQGVFAGHDDFFLLLCLLLLDTPSLYQRRSMHYGVRELQYSTVQYSTTKPKIKVNQSDSESNTLCANQSSTNQLNPSLTQSILLHLSPLFNLSGSSRCSRVEHLCVSYCSRTRSRPRHELSDPVHLLLFFLI